MQLIGILRARPGLGADFLNRGGIENAERVGRRRLARTARVHGLGTALFQGSVVEEGVRFGVQDFVRQGRRLRQIAREALDFTLLDFLKQSDQSLNVHGLRQTVFDRLADEWMLRNFTVTRDIFETSELVGKHRRQEIFRFHALQRRWNLAAAALPGQGKRARGIPAPANREHRRIQQRLDQQIPDGFAVEIAEDFVEGKRMLCPQR